MALGDSFKITQEIIDNFEDTYYVDLTDAITPFSKLNNNENVLYIYFGFEKIPFKLRDPEYQEILIAEFVS